MAQVSALRFAPRAAAWLSAALTLSLVPEALAGGFEIPDHGARAMGRGGAYTVGAKDLTAAHYNPATMAKFRGTRLMISHTSLHQSMKYSRAPLGPSWVDAAGESIEGTAFGNDDVEHATEVVEVIELDGNQSIKSCSAAQWPCTRRAAGCEPQGDSRPLYRTG